MNIMCVLKDHEPEAQQVWNRGYHFSRCRRCGCDMIRSDLAWELVPKGHRVVWKNGYHSHSVAAEYSCNLPVLCRSAQTGTRAALYGGWHRQLLLLAGGGGQEIGTQDMALEDPEEEREHYSYLLAAAALAGAGLQLLMRYRTSRSYGRRLGI
jgi:hypothetical protein